ncbi:motility associated factor glycosyltransferase family protein [Paucisalibacillus sp. EB02]|uniref:motility associated factor glycosyltransferase family protein n=1 Tax=Paucisalibacillus sp. EB02 TaxID=1347087 RepID=UPI0004B1C333|nr:6-hydroxymethylpterin diphosphokinase MptE-like protein [Paucisalibacillus sp. EB02]
MLIENTLLLRERFPDIRHYFRDNEDGVGRNHITVLDSKAGPKTIRYETGENKQLMIHSLYDPIREADRIISSHKGKIGKDTHVFFYGIGMGYHIEKFQELFPGNSYSVYEPVQEIFLTMTEQRQLKQIITANTRNLYVDTHDTESNGYLEEFVTNNRNIYVITLPSYNNIDKEKILHFHKKLKKGILDQHMALNTNAKFQKLWVKNSILNFNTVLNTPNILKDINRTHFSGKPAIIVSAGPSLAEDIQHLKYIKDNNLAYIFSVGSAINSLIEYNVIPDAVCTYDPGEQNYLVFKKMIEHNITDIPMLFGSSVGYETLTRYKGPKVHFITTQDRTSLYLLNNQLDLKQDLIFDSPSIAVMTFQVLNKLGADPIIFSGQNLGYLHERRYSEGIEYDFIQSTVGEEELERSITTEDVYGNQIKTNLGFINMRESIEIFASKYTGGTFINTTKGGAAIKGVPFQPIEKVIEENLLQTIEKSNWWEYENNYDQSGIERQLEDLKKGKLEFQDLTKGFKKVLESISTSIKIRNKSSLIIALNQFDTLYNQQLENGYYSNFLSFYIRIHVEYLGNEIKSLNQERDVFTKGEEIVRLFSGFMEECKQGWIDLDIISLETILSRK